MKKIINLVCKFTFLLVLSGMLVQNGAVVSQVCSNPSTVIYGLNNAGNLHPVTVSTGVVGAQLNLAYTGNAALSSNGVGYSQLNGNFYYFKRPPGSAPQEFVSFNPVTKVVTVLADCPTTYSVYVGCLTNDGLGYYCWDSQANFYYYSVAANTWTFITNVIIDQGGADVTAILKAHGSGDAAIDGKGNMLMFPSSNSRYALYELKAPLPKTAVASITVKGLIALTSPPSGFKFGGIAFNASGQIILSTTSPSNKLYQLENNYTFTFLSNLTSDMGDLTSCNFPMVVLPVLVSNFTANENNGQALIKWQVASSSGITAYQVEHSVNGKEWKEISYSNKIGATSYSYTHYTPAKGFNYYRLAFSSTDGEKKYSETRTVNMDDKNVYAIWPNPVRQDLRIEVNTSNENPVKAVIFDHTGKIIKENNLVAGVNSVNVKTFAAGIYVVKITSTSGETYFQKLIKE